MMCVEKLADRTLCYRHLTGSESRITKKGTFSLSLKLLEKGTSSSHSTAFLTKRVEHFFSAEIKVHNRWWYLPAGSGIASEICGLAAVAVADASVLAMCQCEHFLSKRKQNAHQIKHTMALTIGGNPRAVSGFAAVSDFACLVVDKCVVLRVGCAQNSFYVAPLHKNST